MSEQRTGSAAMQRENVRLPLWKKICYGCGAGGGNVMSTLLASFLLSYYTDTAGIAAAAVGTMFVICRLLDGVTDFAMGGIVDKTNTKWGKARPWLVLCAPLMCIGIILIVSVPQGWSEAAKLVYAYVTYIFLNCVVYTIFGIAHTALLARMTRDFKDRNTTSTVSSILNNLVGLVVGTMITGLQMKFGWTITGIVLGIIAGVLILIPGIACEEDSDEGAAARSSEEQVFLDCNGSGRTDPVCQCQRHCSTDLLLQCCSGRPHVYDYPDEFWSGSRHHYAVLHAVFLQQVLQA